MNIDPKLYEPRTGRELAVAVDAYQKGANDPAPREPDPLLGADARVFQEAVERNYPEAFMLTEKLTREQLEARFPRPVEPEEFNKLIDTCVEMLTDAQENIKRLYHNAENIDQAVQCLARLEGRIARLENPPYPFVREPSEAETKTLQEASWCGSMQIVASRLPYYDIVSDAWVFPDGLRIPSVVLYKLSVMRPGDRLPRIGKAEDGCVYLLGNT